uniref:Uncharacterized protein n=1 Tax=Anguilla anguilla TaxID=7936 RepID=A0A0E9WAA0_ANGAN
MLGLHDSCWQLYCFVLLFRESKNVAFKLSIALCYSSLLA